MNTFTIRDIENLCGIKAHTLRIWEQRYKLLSPKRKESNHRLYDTEDLRYLLRIAYLYHNGYRISSIARMSEEEICRLALSRFTPDGSSEIFLGHLTEASMDFDQERFDKILHNVILHMGFEKAMSRVIFPFLQKIGLLWLTGNVIPAQEHFASALIIKKIYVATAGLEEVPPVSDRRVLLFTPKGEMHEIPLLYMRYLMKKTGIASVYFGKDIALPDLQFYCQRKPVTHLYFHLITNLLRCDPDQYIGQLTSMFPDKQIVASGSLGELRTTYPNVRVLKGMEEMIRFATEPYM